MEGRSNQDGHHDHFEDSSLRKGGKAKRNNSSDVGWTARVQNQKLREDGADGDVDLVAAAATTAGLSEEPGQDVKAERVKEQRRKSRDALCVPQPRSEDMEVKKKPLAAMRIVLQKRRGNNPEAPLPAGDLSEVPDRSALDKRQAKGPNKTAGPKRFWAKIVKGTDQDSRTSLKNNKEAIKGERCEGKAPPAGKRRDEEREHGGGGHTR